MGLLYRTVQLELRLVSYAEADELILDGIGKPERERWRIAPQEGRNLIGGVVFLERSERVPRFRWMRRRGTRRPENGVNPA